MLSVEDINRLEAENKQLKKEHYEVLKKYKDEYESKRKYKFTLIEINLILDELKQQYDYMSDYAEIKEIQDKINEVLK